MQDNGSLVYTNESCIGCNKCISACSCVGACVAVEDENGANRIEVSGDKCVACGACFDVCEHRARAYRDDTEQFFADLAKGETPYLFIDALNCSSGCICGTATEDELSNTDTAPGAAEPSV